MKKKKVKKNPKPGKPEKEVSDSSDSLIKSTETEFLQKAQRILKAEQQERVEKEKELNPLEETPAAGPNSESESGNGSDKDEVIKPKAEDILTPEEFERLSKNYEENVGQLIKFIFNGLIARRAGSIWILTPEEEKTIVFYSRKCLEQVLPVIYAKYTPILGLIATIGAYAGSRIATIQSEKKQEVKKDESEKSDKFSSGEKGERKDPIN